MSFKGSVPYGVSERQTADSSALLRNNKQKETNIPPDSRHQINFGANNTGKRYHPKKGYFPDRFKPHP